MIKGLKQTEYDLVLNILRALLPVHTKVHFYGSRVVGKHRKYSDLDIAIETKGSVSGKLFDQLSNAFAESNLPYLVDLQDYHRLSAEFKAIVDANCITVDLAN